MALAGSTLRRYSECTIVAWLSGTISPAGLASADYSDPGGPGMVRV